MKELSNLLVYIPGIIIFLVGSRQAGDWLRRNVLGHMVTAKVVSCNHVHKKDGKDRDVFNFYNVLMEYTNPVSRRVQRMEVKSIFELVKGQNVKITLDRKGANPDLAENIQEYNLHPMAMALVGAFFVLFAYEINSTNEMTAAIYFGLASVVAGGSMFLHHIALKKKDLTLITGKIIDVYKRQISKESKIIKGSKFTNYPIVQFQVNGQDVNFRPEVNSGGDKEFQVGDDFQLYYDSKNDVIYEKAFSLPYLLVGVALVLLGALILASVVSVML